MTATPQNPFTTAAIVINLIIFATAFYAAWENLSNKRISNFGFDAFLLLIIQFFDKKIKEKVRKDPKLIQRMGFMMMLFGIGCLFEFLSLINGS